MVAIITLHLTPRGLFYNWRTDEQGDLFYPCFSVLASEEEEGITLHVQNGLHSSEGQPVTRPPVFPLFSSCRAQ